MKTKWIAAAALVAVQSWTISAAAETSSDIATQGGTPDQSGVAPLGPEEHASEGQSTVLMSSTTELGAFGGPDIRMTSILASPALLLGAQASWLADHRFFFGLAGYGLATRHDAPDTMRIEGSRSTLGMMYGGLRLGLVSSPHRLVHLTVAALLGPGSLFGVSNVATPGEFEVGYERQVGHAEAFLVVEPEIAAELNATTFMRIAAGASYRYVTGVEQPGLSSSNLSAPAASLAFKFGVF
jgi:hypothetical protein